MAVPVSNWVAEVGNPRIDGLVQGSSWRFGGGPRTLTYSLNVAFDTDLAPGKWTTAWKNAIAKGFDAWEAVANVDFDRAGGVGTQLQNKSTADIAIALERAGRDLPLAGIGVFPSPSVANLLLDQLGYSRTSGEFPYPRPEGDIAFVSDHRVFDSLQGGSFGYKVVLHEIGHALGLKHPDDGGGNSRPTFKELGIGSLDSPRNTVMTTKNPVDFTSGQAPATPMPLDILAVQRIYGANMSHRTGDDVYRLSASAPLRTIWDAGGNDTFNASGWLIGSDVTFIINLNGGSFSGLKNSKLATAIAYNVVIEHAIGTMTNDLITGNAANNHLSGRNGNDTINGGDGSDTLEGGGGFNVLNGGNGNDTIIGVDLDTISGGKGDDTITMLGGTARGGSGADTITVTGSEDVHIHGDDGSDVITLSVGGRAHGGRGADTIHVSSGQGIVDGDGGNDILTTAEGNDSLDGGAGDDVLSADAGNDTIFGGTGADAMTGGTGDDAYFVDDSGDTVAEGPGEGIDTLTTPFATSLEGTNLENLTLSGTSNIDATGNALGNVLTGNSGANTLTGGLGDDTYVIQNGGDAIVENEDEGIDTVAARFDYSLADTHLENVTLKGSEVLNATGNPFDNTLTGNAAASTLAGGSGDDTYVVKHAAQNIVENTDEGIDGVQSSFTHKLAANVEHLTLTGDSDINGTGNSLDNTLTGNSGDNLLDGKGGADTVRGGGGNDNLVWDASDLVLDGGSGIDVLRVNGSDVHVNLTTLPDGTVENVERINLTGSGKNTLTLNPQEVLDLSSTSSTLRVLGNAGDTVHRGAGWTTGADQVLAGNSYHSYTKGLATLLVDSDITSVV